MSHPEPLDQSVASTLQKQLNADPFIQLLASTTLFRNIPPSELPLSLVETISKTARVITREKNEFIEIETDRNRDIVLYEILSGFVKIYDREPPRSDLEEELVTDLPALLAWRVPGELLGDFQFTIPGKKLTDHIVATDRCQLLGIPGSVIRTVASSFPQLYLNIATNLAIKAIKARIRAQILRLPNIKCMVAKLFIELLEERDVTPTTEGLRLVNGTFKIDDVAAFLGYEYHGTQLGVRSLLRQGLIKHYETNKSGRFAICDEAGLHEYLEEELAKAARKKKQRRKRRPPRNAQ